MRIQVISKEGPLSTQFGKALNADIPDKDGWLWQLRLSTSLYVCCSVFRRTLSRGPKASAGSVFLMPYMLLRIVDTGMHIYAGFGDEGMKVRNRCAAVQNDRGQKLNVPQLNDLEQLKQKVRERYAKNLYA